MSDQPELKLMVHETMANLERALDELQENLKDIGYNKETRVMYYERANNHIDDLLKEMVDESQMKKQLLLDSIEDLLQQTTILHMELHLDMVHKTYDQIPLYNVEQMLRADLQNLECMKKKRMAILKELLAKEHEICKKLGAKKQNISTNVVPTEQKLESFKLYLQRQEAEKIHLENIFVDLHHFIIKMMDDLDVSPCSSFEQLVCDNPEKFVFNTNNMAKLKELKDELKTQVEETKCRVDKMREDLLALWKYLNEPSDACQVFLDKYPGYNTITINALSAEMKHCKEKKEGEHFQIHHADQS